MDIVKRYIDNDSSNIIRDYLIGDKKYWKEKNSRTLYKIKEVYPYYDFTYKFKEMLIRDLFNCTCGYNIKVNSYHVSKKRDGMIVDRVKKNKVLFYGNGGKEIDYHQWY